MRSAFHVHVAPIQSEQNYEIHLASVRKKAAEVQSERHEIGMLRLSEEKSD